MKLTLIRERIISYDTWECRDENNGRHFVDFCIDNGPAIRDHLKPGVVVEVDGLQPYEEIAINPRICEA